MGSLAEYELLQKIGRGGMATVYLARRHGAERPCVLKLMSQTSVASFQKRFVREAKAASVLAHPGIAQIYDAGFEDERPYMAMELVVGQTLGQLFKQLGKDGLPWGEVVWIAVQALEALDHAHDRRDEEGRSLGIVHRDLSAGNIMLGERGVVKIIDFGLVRMEGSTRLTAAGAVAGTLRFLAPEQTLGEEADHRADLYALSVSLYELICGRRLIQPGKPGEVVHAIQNLSPAPLSPLAPGIPQAAEAAILKGLAKQPKLRWATALDYRTALIEAAPGALAQAKHSLAARLDVLFAVERAAQKEAIAIAVAQGRAEAIPEAYKAETKVALKDVEIEELEVPRPARSRLMNLAGALVGVAVGLVLFLVAWGLRPEASPQALTERPSAQEAQITVRPAAKARSVQVNETVKAKLPRPAKRARSRVRERPVTLKRSVPGAPAQRPNKQLVDLRADIERLILGRGDPALYEACIARIGQLSKRLPASRRGAVEAKVEAARFWSNPRMLKSAYDELLRSLKAQPPQ